MSDLDSAPGTIIDPEHRIDPHTSASVTEWAGKLGVGVDAGPLQGRRVLLRELPGVNLGGGGGEGVEAVLAGLRALDPAGLLKEAVSLATVLRGA